MNILYLASDPAAAPKGAGVRIRRTVDSLCRLGHQVRLFTPAGPERTGEAGGARDLENGQGSGSPGTRLPDALHEHVTVSLPAGNFLQRMMAFRDAAARWLDGVEGTSDSLVQFRGIWEGMAALEWARARGARLVYEAHGFPSVELPFHYPTLDRDPGVLEKLIAEESLLLENAGLMLTHSQTGRRFLMMRGVPEHKIAVVPNAVDPLLFSPEPSLAPPPAPPAGDPPAEPANESATGGPAEPTVEPTEDTPFRILYLGTAAPWQGLSHLLEALVPFRGQGQIELQVIGPRKSVWLRELRQSARRLRVRHILHLSEPIDQPALVPLLRAAHLCAAPLPADSRNALQGTCPIKVLEYMAVGRPILATAVAPLMEILEHGRNAYLVKPASPAALAEGIGWMLKNPERREQLGRQAREDVLARFTPELFDARLAAALNRLA